MEVVFVITHVVMLSSFLAMLFACRGLKQEEIGKEFPHRAALFRFEFFKITSVEITTMVAGLLTALM